MESEGSAQASSRVLLDNVRMGEAGIVGKRLDTGLEARGLVVKTGREGRRSLCGAWREGQIGGEGGMRCQGL